jgi:hypothetical protein
MSETSTPETDTPLVEGKVSTKLGETLFGWTSHPKTGLFVFAGMLILSAGLFIGSFLVHPHEYFHFAEFPGFYAMFGFVAFGGVVLTGWPLRKLLGRPEAYYEPEDAPRD